MYTIQFNNYILQESDGFNISSVNGLGVPQKRVSEENTTGTDGGNVWEVKYGMRTISIEGTIFGEDFTQYFSRRTAFANAFGSNGRHTLVITRPDGVSATTTARCVFGPEFTEVTGQSMATEFRVELRCESSFLSLGSIIESAFGLAIGGGTPVASPVPSPVGGGTGGIQQINYIGSNAVFPRIVVTGEVSNPTISNATYGEFVRFNGSLVIGDELVIELLQSGLVVTKNGVNVVANFTSNAPQQLWTLRPGVNDITFSASSPSNTAQCQISYEVVTLSI